MTKLVIFNGTKYWYIKDDNHGPLAPLEHCDENGNIKDFETGLFAESFAHVFPDGNIMRYGKVIGTENDLIDATLAE